MANARRDVVLSGMSRFLRIARSAGVVAAIWAVGWSAVGFLFSILLALGLGLPFARFVMAAVNVTLGFGILGFSAGAIFSVALSLLEWGAPAEQLTRSRVALAGAVGGAALPLVTSLSSLGNGASVIGLAIALMIFALLGTASALGTLRLVSRPAAPPVVSDREPAVS